MSRTFEIHVKQEHIDKGARGRCSCCPIALALNDQIPGHGGASVGFGTISLIGKDRPGFSANLPHRVNSFVAKFDRGWDVEPFSFLLTFPAMPEEAVV